MQNGCDYKFLSRTEKCVCQKSQESYICHWNFPSTSGKLQSFDIQQTDIATPWASVGDKKLYCQAQVQIQIQSRSFPGAFQIYFKSFQSIPIQNPPTTTTTHPETFLELMFTQNKYRVTSSHEILIVI